MSSTDPRGGLKLHRSCVMSQNWLSVQSLSENKVRFFICHPLMMVRIIFDPMSSMALCVNIWWYVMNAKHMDRMSKLPVTHIDYKSVGLHSKDILITDSILTVSGIYCFHIYNYRTFGYRSDPYCFWHILFPPNYRTYGTFLSVIKSAAWDLCSHIFSSPFYFNTNMHLISHNTRPIFPKYSISRSSNFCLETICYANIMCKFTAYLWIFKGSVYMCKCTQYGSDGPWHEADIIDMY